MKGPCLRILAFALAAPLFPCTTFQIQGKSSVAVGHNFETYIQNFPGSLFYNPPGEGKTSFTIEGDVIPEPAAESGLSRIFWTSRYRSLTYNVMGKNLPDGGINDQGLYVGEMSLTSSSQDREPGMTYFSPPPLYPILPG